MTGTTAGHIHGFNLAEVGFFTSHQGDSCWHLAEVAVSNDPNWPPMVYFRRTRKDGSHWTRRGNNFRGCTLVQLRMIAEGDTSVTYPLWIPREAAAVLVRQIEARLAEPLPAWAK